MTPLRIYLVEDSSIIRDNLIETLNENAAVQVVGTAVDEASAVHWLTGEGRCDVAIVDIFLKQGTGIGVLQALAGHPGSPLRMVFSNHATPEIRAKCEELGAAKVFDKSNEIDEMLGWLNRLPRSDRTATASRS